MEYTQPLRENYMFRRLYRTGSSKVSPYAAVYVKKGRGQRNRLGITTSKKLGCAVRRNRAKRVIKEAYRLLEPRLRGGYDIVVVARTKAVSAKMQEISGSLQRLFSALGLMRDGQ
jgi:ribonuclease P protein component